MAITDINLSGKVRADDGSAVSGATVTILETSDALTGSAEGSAYTTTSTGRWTFTEQTLTETYDVKISSAGGGQVRYIPWSDEITLKTVDASVMKIRGVAGAAAPLYFFADRADDAGDAWRINVTDHATGTLAIGSDKAVAGTIIDYITITNGATAAASNTTILGQLTIGVDDTGADVKFFGATANTYMLWDESTDDLVLTLGAELYFYDAAGGEHIKSDGTDMTIYAGTDLNLTAGTDINIPADVGLTFGNDAEKIEGDGTDLTVSGNNINLTAVADVNIPSGVGLTFATTEKIESDGTDLTITVGSSGDINVSANIGITFGDDAEKIEGDGTDLTISGNNINLTATADVVIPADVGITFGSGEKIEGDSTDLTITSGAKINLTATSDVVIPANVGITFGSGEKIEGDSTDLTITSGAKINLTATSDVVIPANVGITFGTGEKIEGDSTDLTITSGADINLTATADVNMPADVGITFGDDAEKIEGDGTDLTIAGNNINLTAVADVVIPADVGLTFGSGEKIEGDNTDLTITSGGDIVLASTESVFINDTANTKMTVGLTINQGAADNEILAFQSSDVTHGITNFTETDTYGEVKKLAATGGGLSIRGLSDADYLYSALGLFGILGGTAQVGKATSASGLGVIRLTAGVANGTGAQAVGSNGNLVSIDNYDTVRFIFDAEGSGHADVEWTTFDTYDDVALMDAVQSVAVGRMTPARYGANSLYYNKEYLESTGIIGKDSWHEEDGKPRQMVNFTKLSMLHHGAILQIGDAIKALEAENRALKALIGR
jgi:hypothetical protein